MAAENHFFCMLKPSRPDLHLTVSEAEKKIFDQHSYYLRTLFEEKKLLQAGTSFESNEEGFAIVILQAETKENAIAMIADDPAVASGLLRPHVTQYGMFLDRALA